MGKLRIKLLEAGRAERVPTMDHNPGQAITEVIILATEGTLVGVEKTSGKLFDFVAIEVRCVVCLLEEIGGGVLQLFHLNLGCWAIFTKTIRSLPTAGISSACPSRCISIWPTSARPAPTTSALSLIPLIAPPSKLSPLASFCVLQGIICLFLFLLKLRTWPRCPRKPILFLICPPSSFALVRADHKPFGKPLRPGE